MEGNDPTPSGLGNQCSVEFNLAYRWHSAISANDEKWTEQIYEELMGKPAKDVTVLDLKKGLGKYAMGLSKDPSERTFAHLKRQEDGTFKDEELVSILANAIEDVAGNWNVGSLNEFRKFFDLKPYERFEDINSDEEVVEALRHLYGHPDYVELYPGIVAEDAKQPMVPGVGIAPTYTISRAVDYNPRNLTNWGYNEVRYDLNVNQGCVFYKLATRAFPNWFKSDSIYAHYPMTIPSENRNIMKDLGRESDFSYERPSFTPPHVNLVSYPNVKLALEREEDFRVVWNGNTPLASAKGGDDFWSKSLDNDQWRNSIKEFYEDITAKLLQEKSGNLAGLKQVDITRDIFFDVDKTKSFSLHHAARAVAEQLGHSVENHVKSINSPSFLSGIIGNRRNDHNALKEYGDQLIKKLLESGLGVSDVTYSQVLPAAVAMVHNQAQMEDSKDSEDKLMRYCLEGFRLNGTFGSYREAQTDLSMTEETGNVNIKRGDRVFVGAVSASSRLTLSNNARSCGMANIQQVKANRDPQVFPDPNEVHLDRPLESYIQYGLGPHTGLGKETTLLALTSMLRVVGGLDNLRRAPGPQGELKKIHREGGYYVYLREDWGSYSPFPTSKSSLVQLLVC
ncbi:unnamed protein product [Aspergillus oryzae]|uniref:Unnamed protein product n=1 Tax=Aspergillus oryzae TaxID=5062 RepID=A0AAN4YV83_ASPOZ|nr:unnamed protein product [Aspergillus oryzae]GMG33874.1 unnamed protein product [Aspergillus oryzae]